MIRTSLAITWDFGQTLADLDPAFLSQKLSEQGLLLPPKRSTRPSPAPGPNTTALSAAAPAAIRGRRSFAPSSSAGAPPSIEEVAELLWQDQPKRNLWRRPVPGMMDVVRGANAAGVAQGIVSNSEGKLAELVQDSAGRRRLAPSPIRARSASRSPAARSSSGAPASSASRRGTSCTSATRTPSTSTAPSPRGCARFGSAGAKAKTGAPRSRRATTPPRCGPR